jgi:hypothetical protein
MSNDYDRLPTIDTIVRLEDELAARRAALVDYESRAMQTRTVRERDADALDGYKESTVAQYPLDYNRRVQQLEREASAAEAALRASYRQLVGFAYPELAQLAAEVTAGRFNIEVYRR